MDVDIVMDVVKTDENESPKNNCASPPVFIFHFQFVLLMLR